MAFVQKELFFQIRPGKCLVRYSRTEKPLPRPSEKEVQKVENWHFSQGVNPWFWSKKGHFSNFFFRQFRPGKCLLRYSKTKKPLSRLSEKDVQKVEKVTFFPTFFFRQFRPGKCLLRYSRTKKCLSRISKEEVQKLEKLTFFSKGLTHGFGPKVFIFPTFFF